MKSPWVWFRLTDTASLVERTVVERERERERERESNDYNISNRNHSHNLTSISMLRIFSAHCSNSNQIVITKPPFPTKNSQLPTFESGRSSSRYTSPRCVSLHCILSSIFMKYLHENHSRMICCHSSSVSLVRSAILVP